MIFHQAKMTFLYYEIMSFLLCFFLLFFLLSCLFISGFPDSSVGKEPACKAGDPGLIPGWGRSPGFCLVYTEGQLIPQYERIDFSPMQEMKKAVIVYGPHSPFTKELLNACLKVKVKLLRHVQPFATSWTVAFQAPLSMGFSRQ